MIVIAKMLMYLEHITKKEAGSTMEQLLEKLHEVKFSLQQTVKFGGIYFNDHNFYMEYVKDQETYYFQITHETAKYLSTNQLEELLLTWFWENEPVSLESQQSEMGA